MRKGGLLKTLRAYKSTLLIFALLLIIAFSIFNTQKRKLIENLEGFKGTTGTTKGTTKTTGQPTGQPTTPTIRTNNKYLEVFLWYDPANMGDSRGERIVLYEYIKNAFCSAKDPYVIFQTNNAADYIEYFMTDPERANLKTNVLKETPGTDWERWKSDFIKEYAPIISVCILDKSVTPPKRTYLVALWMNMPGSMEILYSMITANRYMHKIGVAMP
jgi:hypothetical protein